ncbi:flagellar hook-basal body complex protein FliE [Natroniella sulfidigena]|uniref:flagellar hook-basal body complex protein FliE n=1 Tax=Natroniella sulfidigena TaxID=723921 RepID=UPI00200A61B7|nr:flagellar hook-basal body complex protein FliE [Natroniella sulfidigena]MCK8816535.1 flagellar hook-basal body complex protein FliE [Natroniella sulfidigena]
MEINNVSQQQLLTGLNSDDKKQVDNSFGDILKDSLHKVNNLQHQADQAGEDLALGKVDNVHEVMVSAQKAKTSLDLASSVTNKAVEAYKEVMRIQV